MPLKQVMPGAAGGTSTRLLPLRHLCGSLRTVSAPAGLRHVSLRSGVYADSVRLMQVSREVASTDGVSAVLVAMATPLNLELAANMGLAPDGPASPEQLLIAIRAESEEALAAAVSAVDG